MVINKCGIDFLLSNMEAAHFDAKVDINMEEGTGKLLSSGKEYSIAKFTKFAKVRSDITMRTFATKSNSSEERET